MVAMGAAFVLAVVTGSDMFPLFVIESVTCLWLRFRWLV